MCHDHVPASLIGCKTCMCINKYTQCTQYIRIRITDIFKEIHEDVSKLLLDPVFFLYY